jgi:imidazolonepropionase-like amidohydrolase
MWLMVMMITSAARTVTGYLRLEVGKQADVIVANGNPPQDITVLEDLTVAIKGREVIVQP